MHHFHHFRHSRKFSGRDIFINSPWGSLASLFLLQSYGFVLFNGLFFTLAFTFEFFWLLFWVVAMLIMQVSFITKIKSFLYQQKLKDYFLILKEPFELFKFFIAVLALTIFVLFNLGYYPFPTSDQPLVIYLGAEFVISLGLSFYFRNTTEVKVQKDKKKLFLGLIILLFFTFIPLLQKFPNEIFYLTIIPGLGMILFIISQLLIEKTQK